MAHGATAGLVSGLQTLWALTSHPWNNRGFVYFNTISNFYHLRLYITMLAKFLPIPSQPTSIILRIYNTLQAVGILIQIVIVHLSKLKGGVLEFNKIPCPLSAHILGQSWLMDRGPINHCIFQLSIQCTGESYWYLLWQGVGWKGRDGIGIGTEFFSLWQKFRSGLHEDR